MARVDFPRFVLRRLLGAAVLLALVALFSFVLLELAPGDYLDEMRMNPQISPETVAAMRSRYGLDHSLFERYASWILSIGRGELGVSFAYNMPVAALLWPRAWNTLLLSLTATLVSWCGAILAGTWWATRTEGGWLDRAFRVATAVLLGVPEMLLALVFLGVAVHTRAFPVGGLSSIDASGPNLWVRGQDLARHLFLPVLVLVLSGIGLLVRHVRSSVAEVLQAPFVRAVRARGIPERRLLFRYVFPAAANPLITLFGFSVGSLLSGSLVVEVVMGWPGLGPLFLDAILARDVFLVIGAILCSAVFVVGGNVLADVLLYASDPRIRWK